MPQALTEADIYSRLINHVHLAEEACYMIGHFYKEQDDLAYGQGFLAIGEMLKMTGVNITNLATGKLRKQGGLR